MDNDILEKFITTSTDISKKMATCDPILIGFSMFCNEGIELTNGQISELVDYAINNNPEFGDFFQKNLKKISFPKKDKQIVLNEGEQRICTLIAKSRFENNRQKGITNSKVGEQSDELTDLEGIGGEVACAKLYNVMPDFSIHTRSSSEDDGDFRWNKLKFDVKATTYENGRLLATRWKVPSVDYFLLVTGTFPNYIYRGRMKSGELLQESRLIDLGHGLSYAANQSELS
jgi:hypothetical protein